MKRVFLISLFFSIILLFIFNISIVFASNQVVEYDFDGNFNDKLSNSTLSQVDVASAFFGSDAGIGGDTTFWSWTPTSTLDNSNGGGFTVDVNQDISRNYSIGVRFVYNSMSTSWDKIIDYKNRTSDNGFYFINGILKFYPHAPQGSMQINPGDIVDVVATRNSSDGKFIAYIVQNGSLVKEVEVDDAGIEYAVPTIVNSKTRFGFFFDDGNGEGAKDGGRVYSVKMWDGPITSQEAEVAMDVPDNAKDLSSLAISEGELSPNFSSGTINYNVNLANSVTEIAVTPTKADANASIIVNGVSVESGSASQSIPLSVGSNTITIVVTAVDESTKTYTVTVNRAAAAAILSYNFEDNVLDSSGYENHGTTGGTVSYAAGHTGKAINLNGNGWVNLPNNLILNNTSFTVSMWFKTSTDGGLFGYQNSFVGSNGSTCTEFVPVLSVRSDGKLYAEMWTGASMTVTSAGVVNDNQWHRVVMTSGTNSIRVYLDGVDIGGANGVPQHLSMNINQVGTNAGWGRTGHPGAFIWNNFNGLIDEFLFYPAAQSAVEVAKTSQSITFDALANKLVTDAPFALNATASSGLSVSFTSSNPAVATVSGSTVTIVGTGTTDITASQAGDATYSAAPQVVRTLTVNNLSANNNLSNLVPSAGTLSPIFASGTQSYTIEVANGITSIILTPTVSDGTAAVTVNGQGVTSGNQSQAVNLNVGNNSIPVVITAQNGAQKSYTVNVNRYAAPITMMYNNFSDATLNAFLHTSGNAQITGGVARVTPATTSQAGAVFYNNKLKLSLDRSFSSYFTFNFNNLGVGGADGLVYILNTNTNVLGALGGGLGYQGIDHSIGIEFDTYNNAEISANHVAVNINGVLHSTPGTSVEAPYNMKDGSDYHVWVDYNGATDTLEVRMNNSNSRPVAAFLTYSVDLATILNTEDMYVGFSAGTGGSYENHDIKKWYFDSRYKPIEPALYTYTIAPTTIQTALSGNVINKTISATVKDYTGAAVGAGEVVSFSVISGDGTLSAATASTNASGVAEVNVIYNTAVSNTVRASISSGAYSDVTVTFNPPPSITASDGNNTFTKGNPAVAVDNALTIISPTNIDGAKVYITDGFSSGDALNYTNQLGITGSYNAANGVLTLNGTTTAENYQTALRSISFSTTSNNTVNRKIVFSLGQNTLYYAGTEHYYEFVSAPTITWTTAKTNAEARNLYGMQGYLATITSAGENEFVKAKTASNGWIGASDEAVEGTWRWAAGPESGVLMSSGYTNWASGEPNDYGTGEDYGHMYGTGGTAGYWNDFPNSNGSITGYIAEYGGMPGDLSPQLMAEKFMEVVFAPPQLTVSEGAAEYTKGNSSVVVDGALELTSPTDIEGAKVYITDGFIPGDTLNFVNQNGITGVYDATKGVLTFTGTTTAENYQAALRSVTFSNTSTKLAAGLRTIGISVGGGALNYSGTGHYYEYISAPGMTWTNAKTAAEARSLYGMQGYLATITSKGENDFIAKKTTGNGWLGLSDHGNDRAWYWITGPEAGTKIADQWALPNTRGGYASVSGRYNNWASGEPNNYPNNTNNGENYGHMYASGGTWNDYAWNNSGIKGYIVEYGGMPGDASPILSGQKTLNVRVLNDATLSILITNRGAVTPLYDINNTSTRYELSVANNISDITVTPTTTDGAAVVKVNGTDVASGSASGNISLTVGMNTINIVVKAADNITTKAYTLIVYRQASNNADLSNITLSCGILSPVFNAGTTKYTVNVAYDVSSVTITPTAEHIGASIKAEGVDITNENPSIVVLLNPGATRNANMVVKAENGITTKTYHVAIKRAASSNNKLAALLLKGADLNESFSQNTNAYTSTVENNIASIRVIPTVSDKLASIKVDNVGVASGAESSDIPLTVGANTITVRVTAQDGSANNYTITVTRKASNNANLSNLTANTGRMSPSFDKEKTAYTLVVSSETNTIRLTPTKEHANASITVNEAVVNSGNESGEINIAAGSVVTVAVRAQDAVTTKTYTVRVLKEELVSAKYADFSTDTNLLQVNNNAQIVNNELVLTQNLTNQRGSAFYKNRVSLDNKRSFSSFFKFNLSGQGGIGQADGIVFTIQTVSNTAGSSGGGMGYSGLNPSIGIEFDTWRNTNVSDPVGPHIGFNVNGNIVSSQAVLTAPLNIRDGRDYYAWIDYNGTTRLLEVRLSDTDNRPNSASMTVNNVDLQSILNMDEIYVGFTGATGGASQRQAIKSWYFNNDYSPINTSVYSYQETPASVTLSANPQDNTNTSTITARVFDKNGNRVSGAVVNFSTDRGILESVQGVTDENGQVQSILTASGKSGAATVKAVVTGGAYGKVTIGHLNLTDAESVDADKEAVEVIYSPGDYASSVTRNVTLSTIGENNTVITWISSDADSITTTGTVTRPSYFTGDKFVVLIATITKGLVSEQKVFKLNVRKLPYTAPTIVNTQNIFSESAVNDGSIIGAQTINITGGTFAETISTSDIIVNNLPAGLGVVLNRISDTSLSIGFTGNAADHAKDCSTQNVSVTIPKSKILGTLGDLTTGNFAISFLDPARIYMSEAEVLEPDPFITGEISGTLTINIINGSFAEDITVNDLKVNNLPNDLEAVLVSRSETGSQLVIRFTGNALVHENADDINDASVTVYKEKIIGSDKNISTNTFKINFNEPEPIMSILSTEIRESEENDGSLIGTETVTLLHGTFAADITAADVVVTGLPEGLNITGLERLSNTALRFCFAGNALSHELIDSISNARVQVYGEKITPENILFANNTLPIQSNSFSIKFISPPPVVTVQNSVIHESDAKDGSITATQIVRLKNGAFTGVTNDDVKVNNLPEGIGINVVENNPTTLTISFTGNAASINSASANASATIAGSKISTAKTNLTTDTFVIQCPTNATWAELDKTWLQIIYADGDSINSVTKDVGLAGIGPKDSVITWSSDKPEYISNSGNLTRPTFTQGDKVVTLTATITNGTAASITKEFLLTVKKLAATELEAVTIDKDAVDIGYEEGDNINSVTQNVYLRELGENGSTITWITDKPNFITANGFVTRTTSNQTVRLTAVITKGLETTEKTFELRVKSNAANIDKEVLGIVYAAGDSATSVTKTLYLAPKGQSGNTNIVWSSSPSIISPAGKVTRPGMNGINTEVTITATITDTATNEVVIKTFTVIVKKMSELEAAQDAAKQLTMQNAFTFSSGDKWESITTQFIPLTTIAGANITWSSGDNSTIQIVNINGTITAVVTRPSGSDKNVILSADITIGNSHVSKTFLLIVQKTGVEKEENATRQATVRDAIAEVSAQGAVQQNFDILRTILENQTNPSVAPKVVDTIVLSTAAIQNLTDVINPVEDESERQVTVTMNQDTNSPADELAVEIPADAVESLSDKRAALNVETTEGSITIKPEVLSNMSERGIDLYFRIVPVNNETAQVQARNNLTNNFSNYRVVGIPREIETNYTSYSTVVTLPLTGIQASDIGTLKVFIEHSDGTTETVTPTIINDNSGQPIAVQFTIDKFSRFQIVNTFASWGGNPVTDRTYYQSRGIDLFVNEIVQLNTAKAETVKDLKGVTSQNILVDSVKIINKIKETNENSVLRIPIVDDAQVVISEMSGELVQLMEQKNSVIRFETNSAIYILPAKEIKLSEKYDNTVNMKDVTVKVIISLAEKDIRDKVNNEAENTNSIMLTIPVDFKITSSYKGNTIEAERFDIFVQRLIPIIEENVGKVTTGVYIDSEGKLSHVPTKFESTEDKKYAVISSLYNSLYTLVEYTAAFNDIENHWAKEAIENTASRMIVEGVGAERYEPDRDITRAEFAAILTRALGLRPYEKNNPFKDVAESDWCYNAVRTAVEFKLIFGYEDGTFRPNNKITREEAMAMTARAMKITQLSSIISDSEKSALFEKFADSGNISDWAIDDVSACVKRGIILGDKGKLNPKDNITRAEVAAVIIRFLQKSKLID